MSTDPQKNIINRRGFLKSSFLGLATAAEAVQAEASLPKGKSIFWADLESGNIGYPTGTSVPCGQPGSIMKLVAAAALRENGYFQRDEKLECRGSVVVKSRQYSCLYPHGKVDITQAIGMSCNVFFARASQQLPAEAIVEYARKFGLDEPVAGHDPESFPAKIVPDPALYALGLAEDLRPGALQIMRIAALIALAGKPKDMQKAGSLRGLHDMPPGRRTADGLWKEIADGSYSQLVLRDATWSCLEQGMRICGRKGTARKLDPADKLKLAVKTGTAPHGKTFQSWVTGYFPANRPRYVFCVRALAGTSQDAAVPYARAFLFSTAWTAATT